MTLALGATRAVAQAKTTGQQCNVSQIAARFHVPRSTLASASSLPEGQRRAEGRPKYAQKSAIVPKAAQPASKRSGSSVTKSAAKSSPAVQQKKVSAGKPKKTRSLGALQASQHATEARAAAATGGSRKPPQPQQPTRAARSAAEQLVFLGRAASCLATSTPHYLRR